jgi:hypothetical protein
VYKITEAAEGEKISNKAYPRWPNVSNRIEKLFLEGLLLFKLSFTLDI